ncbi:MAG: hypothetical protein EBT15_11880 [Betaproteobacteria bacterium]|nr:hypothetical protein [Betaproteobacteria bacterium]
MAMQSGIADLMSALPELFNHPMTAAAALSQALAMHCRLWGIPETAAAELLAASFSEYQTRKH